MIVLRQQWWDCDGCAAFMRSRSQLELLAIHFGMKLSM